MKRLFALMLAISLALSVIVLPAAAIATGTGQDEMLSVLAILSVMNGDENGELNLSGSVTRAQFAKMAVAASAYGDTAASNTGISPFSDVSGSHWAASYVTTARDLGWLYGYLDGSFRPNNGVTYAEAATVVLRMLGYSDSYFTGTWPSGQMSTCRSIDLDKNISASENSTLSRLQCAWLIYNALGAETSSGIAFAQSLGYALDASGNIGYLELINSELEGPLVADNSSWTGSIGFVPSTVYLNDETSSTAAVTAYDVLYYIESISTVWAYSVKHTGTLDAVLPGRSSPTSIVVSGVTYALGSSSASVAVSSIGSFKTGDAVTLLMGRDGVVAAIVGASDVDDTVYGVVTGSGTATYTASTGSYYSSKYVDVLGSDGLSYRFTVSRDFSNGTIVKAGSSGGSVTVTNVTSGTLSGKVNASGTTFGNYKFADDAEILDVYGSSGITVSPSRLAGASFTSGDVIYYKLNSNGEIQVLMLDDATGDIHTYGVLTAAQQVSTGTMSFSCYYTSLINGAELTFAIANTSAGAEKGDCVQIKSTASVPEAVKPLEQVRLSSLGTATATTATGSTMPLYADAQVYILRGSEYYYTSADQITSGYTLYGWYDTSSAGQIRVIIAK